MTRVSKFKLQQKEIQEINEHFLYLLSSLRNSQEIENFLEEFLSREEKMMLAKRLVLVMMIQREYSPSVIKSTLHVSYETVRNYSNQTALKSSQFKKIIDKLINRQQSKEFWQKVDKILKPVDLALRSRTNMKARAKLVSGDWS
ncbi:MAG: Trp family transcriptional regulator [Candidatus Curtissbacteria bacterium]